MAAYDLEEQEQLEELKVWWKQYGNLVTNLILGLSILVAAWYGWGWWQRNQAAQASAVYAQLQKAAGEKDAKRTRDLSGMLIEKFSGSQYAAMGALLSAKVQADANDLPNARAPLQWVTEHAGDEGLRDVARLRLVGVFLEEGMLDEAGKVLAVAPADEYKLRHFELRGDYSAARGQFDEARSDYGNALAIVEPNVKSDDADAARRATAYREMLRAKIDGLASAGQVGAGEGK